MSVLEPIIEVMPEKTAELLEDFHGEGVHCVRIPELDFPVYAFVFYHEDMGIMIDESTIECKPPEAYN